MLFWVPTSYSPGSCCDILCNCSGLKLDLPQVPESSRWSFVVHCKPPYNIEAFVSVLAVVNSMPLLF
jgi:hypothetical protein